MGIGMPNSHNRIAPTIVLPKPTLPGFPSLRGHAPPSGSLAQRATPLTNVVGQGRRICANLGAKISRFAFVPSSRISANICRDTATSVIGNTGAPLSVPAGRQHAAWFRSCICQRCSGMSFFWSGPSTP
jgi:hypothetical protein